ncbi:MAG: tetratricopeptide repeat protein [Acidobacteriota bacterium]|nr:tetratricopeptide repeat protein [Acidobacteriota bacterium]
MKIRMTACGMILAAGLVGTSPAWAACPNDRKTGVYGLVTSLEDEPLPGIEISLTKNIEKEIRPLTLKTSKKGNFTFPRVELFEQGYVLRVASEEYFIRDFHLCVRRGSGEIWQDDEGSLTPDSQNLLPPLRHRGGNARIVLKLAKISEFRPPPMAAEPGSAAEGEAAAAAEPREMTTREKAEEAMALGDFKEAAELFAAAIEQSPEDVELRWQRAEVLAKAGETGAALREGREVLKIDPTRTGVRVTMAEWMSNVGQLGDAVPLLEEQRAQTPEDSRVFRLLVSAYREQGMTGKVRETLEAWAVAAPDEPEVHLELARLAVVEGDFAKSQELYEKLAQQDPDHADRMYTNVGISIMNQSSVSEEDRRRAADAFRKSLEVNPDYARAHVELGYALLGLGELDDARRHFQRFVEIAPSDPRAPEVKGVLAALPG